MELEASNQIVLISKLTVLFKMLSWGVYFRISGFVCQYLKEIADETMSAGEYTHPDLNGIAMNWYCMDCDYKWK
ncbi:MAG: hypothetical protein HN875_00270 [Candidatus Nitrosopelagicus sp.]|jgi:hypothetical protein|nr:hypothetical protein [Candidatus Nitrosopelagicus sp.]